MSGSEILSEKEKREMLEDSRDVNRGRAFEAARLHSQVGSLDEYIDFLSENMKLFELAPSKRITDNYKL